MHLISLSLQEFPVADHAVEQQQTASPRPRPPSPPICNCSSSPRDTSEAAPDETCNLPLDTIFDTDDVADLATGTIPAPALATQPQRRRRRAPSPQLLPPPPLPTVRPFPTFHPAPLDLAFDSFPPGLDPSHGDLGAERTLHKRQQLASLLSWILSTPELFKPGDHIVEFGGGSGHLGLTLAYLRPECTVTIIELKPHGAGLAKRRVAELQLPNVNIIHGDMTKDFPADAQFQLGVGLHPCGYLTDRILKRCHQANAAFCIVPCCYGQLTHTYEDGTLPRSAPMADGCDPANFEKVLRGADYQVRVGNTRVVERSKSEVAKLCMQMVDADRCRWMEEQGYVCAMGSLHPLDCSPKNNLIVGLPAGRRG